MTVGSILSRTVDFFFQVTYLLVVLNAILSWVRPRSYTRSNRWFFQVEDLVHRLVDPMLNPIRSLLPMGRIGIDFSPLILLLLLSYLRGPIVSFLARLPF